MNATLSDGTQVRFWFEYRFYRGDGRIDHCRLTDDPILARRKTTCRVSKAMQSDTIPDEDPIVLATGEAFQHERDSDCKETARKTALAKAVAGLPKEDRRAIWRAYLDRRVNGPVDVPATFAPDIVDTWRKDRTPWRIPWDIIAFSLFGCIIGTILGKVIRAAIHP